MATREEIRDLNMQLSGLHGEADTMSGLGVVVPKVPAFLAQDATDEDVDGCRAAICVLNSFFGALYH